MTIEIKPAADMEAIAYVEAEEKLIAEILCSPEFFHYYAWFPPIGFYASQNRNLWKAMQAVHSEAKPVDLTRVACAMEDLGVMDTMSAKTLIKDLILRWQTPEAADLDYINGYFEVVQDYHKRRAVDDFTATARVTIRNKLNRNWQEELQTKFAAIFTGKDLTESPYVELADFDYMSVQEKERISTGLKKLDWLLAGGFAKGDLSILGARPSMGKSALMIWFAMVAGKLGFTVDLISAEMDMASCYERMLGCAGHLVYQDIPKLRKSNPEKVREAIAKLQPVQNKIAIDCLSKDPDSVLAGIHTSLIKRNPDLIILDHLHHIEPGNDRDGAVRVRKFVTNLKNIAQSTNTHIMILVQLNRGVENRADKRPCLGDVREFGCLEELADLMVFPYRDEYYNPDGTTKQNITELCLRKNRNGLTGNVEIYSNLAQNFYGDLVEDEREF